MKAEEKFWQDALQSCHPTWKVQLGRHFDVAKGASNSDVAIYFVDTCGGYHTTRAVIVALRLDRHRQGHSPAAKRDIED
ncbi:MAG: hypothetical protein ING75_17400 [Rhodocyclaceae bacterium]|nr:hypothetical protein [Rhodocyclaceae bacterium]